MVTFDLPTVATQLLSLPAFRAWLESQPADVFVGTAGNEEMCPLATFLKDELPEGTDVAVDAQSYWIESDTTYTLPDWAITFVEVIDSHGEWDVSAHAALDVLRYL